MSNAVIMVDEEMNTERSRVRMRERSARVGMRLLEATLDVYGSLGITPLQNLNWNSVDDDSNTGAYAQIQPPLFQQNQKRGEALPVYITEEQLRWLRDRSRILAFNNEFALCGVENRINYIVGDDGLKYTARPLDQNDKEAKQLAEQTQEFIDTFSELNDLPEVEAESLHRYDVEGEFFLRLFPDSDGMSHLRFIEPEHVRAPNGEGWPPNLSFGIETPADDVGLVEAYHVVESPLITGWTTKRIDESEIVHVKANVKSNAKRGIPTFYPVETNLRRCEDLLASMSHMAKSRAKIALIRTLAGVTSDVAANLLQQLTEVRVTDPATSANLNIERLRYGTVLTTGANAKYEFPAGNVGAADYVEVLQAELRAVAARLQMAEWMFTCLADQKYSNAFVVEAPTLKAFKRIQTRLVRRFGEGRYGNKKSLIWRAIDLAIEAGMLPEKVRQLVKIECNGPTLESRDKAQEATTNKTYFEMGAKSVKTMQVEQGIDPEEEAINLADEANKNRRKQLVEQINVVTAVQTAYYAGQISREAAAALLALLGFAVVECESLLPLAVAVNRAAQPALPIGGGSDPGSELGKGGSDDTPGPDDEGPINDPGHFSDEMEHEGNPNDSPGPSPSGVPGGGATPIRESIVYVEGQQPRAKDGTWIRKQAIDDARGNDAMENALKGIVHPEDAHILEHHLRSPGHTPDARAFNQSAQQAGHLRQQGWATGNKMVDHVVGILDEIRATGEHDHAALFREVHGATAGSLPIARNVMRSMGIKHADFPRTKEGIRNLIWEKVKAEVEKAKTEFHERGKTVAALLGKETREPAHALTEGADRETELLQLRDKLYLQLREAGFSGTITDSLGRTYHFVNGVRVKSATDHTPHEAAHETPHEIASMTGAHPEAGIGELATPLHDLVAKLKKQKKNHATIADYVQKHVAKLTDADRAQLESHFGKLTAENVVDNVNELHDKLKVHATRPTQAIPAESPASGGSSESPNLWDIQPQKESETRGEYLKRTEKLAPRAEKVKTPTLEDIETLRHHINRAGADVEKRFRVTKMSDGSVRVESKAEGGPADPLTPAQSNAARKVLRQLGYVDKNSWAHVLPTDVHSPNVGTFVLDANGPHSVFKDEPVNHVSGMTDHAVSQATAHQTSTPNLPGASATRDMVPSGDGEAWKVLPSAGQDAKVTPGADTPKPEGATVNATTQELPESEATSHKWQDIERGKTHASKDAAHAVAAQHPGSAVAKIEGRWHALTPRAEEPNPRPNDPEGTKYGVYHHEPGKEPELIETHDSATRANKAVAGIAKFKFKDNGQSDHIDDGLARTEQTRDGARVYAAPHVAQHEPWRHDATHITRETLPAVLDSVTAEIVNHDPKLSPNRAKELAAARIRKAIHDKVADIDDRTHGGKITDAEEKWYDEIHVNDWSPSRELEKLSGSRTLIGDTDEPLANKPLSEKLEDTFTPKRAELAANQAKAAEVAESLKHRAAEQSQKAKEHADREHAANIERKRQAKAGEWHQKNGTLVGIGRSDSLASIEAKKRDAVKTAIAAGKPVPPEVLADYPDLPRPSAP